jgi:PKD repeat protein
LMNHSWDCEGEIVEVLADWNGDEIIDETIEGSPPLIQHDFVDPGIYIVMLTVVDDDGETDDWTTQILVAE